MELPGTSVEPFERPLTPILRLARRLTSIRRCRHLNGCPSELSKFLKKLTWYLDITSSQSRIEAPPRSPRSRSPRATKPPRSDHRPHPPRAPAQCKHPIGDRAPDNPACLQLTKHVWHNDFQDRDDRDDNHDQSQTTPAKNRPRKPPLERFLKADGLTPIFFSYLGIHHGSRDPFWGGTPGRTQRRDGRYFPP